MYILHYAYITESFPVKSHVEIKEKLITLFRSEITLNGNSRYTDTYFEIKRTHEDRYHDVGICIRNVYCIHYISINR